MGITPPRRLGTAGLCYYTRIPTIDGVMKVLEETTQTRRYGYVIGALSGLLLPALVVVLIAVSAEEMPTVVSFWPLLAVLGSSVVAWWVQGLIYAVLARPYIKDPQVRDMFRVEMAGLFVALVSPIRGAELPYKVYLLNRLGLSAGEGGNLVVTRVLLDAVVLTPAALIGLPLYFELPEAQGAYLLLAGLVAAVAAFLMRKRVREKVRGWTSRLGGPRWQAKLLGSLRDMRGSFATYSRPGHRTTLLYALALAIVYWALRLCVAPLAFMAAGWSGEWLPVVVAQVLLASFVLPFAPTPGGGGARELGLAVLLSGYVAQGQLLSGLVFHTALSHWLPLVVSAFFIGHELRRRGVPSGVGSGRATRNDGSEEERIPEGGRV